MNSSLDRGMHPGPEPGGHDGLERPRGRVPLRGSGQSPHRSQKPGEFNQHRAWPFRVLDKRQQRCFLLVPLVVRAPFRSSCKSRNEGLSIGEQVERKREKMFVLFRMKLAWPSHLADGGI